MQNFLSVWLIIVHIMLPSFVGTVRITVTILDDHDHGIANVLVMVTDEAGKLLTQGISDATGTAHVAELPPASIRVALRGNLPSGVPIFQTGDDTKGIRFNLTENTTVLVVRADPSGMAFPDPTTMWAVTVGNLPQGDMQAGAALTGSTQPEQPSIAPTTAAFVPQRAPSTMVTSPSPLEESPLNLFLWIGIAVLLAAIGIIAGSVFTAQRKRL